MKYVSGVRWSLALFVLAACGAPSARARVEPEPAPAPRVEPAGSSTCRLEVRSADAIEVHVSGVEPFGVAVSDGVVSLAPTDDPATYELAVTAPLRFDATARADGQLLELSRAGVHAAGSVTAVEGTLVRTLHRDGARLMAELQVGQRVPGARHGLELAVGSVPLGCEDVRGVESDRLTLATPRRVPSVALAVADPPVVLRPVRAAPTELSLRPLERGVPVPLWVLEERGEDARVAIAFSDGARLEGWVAREALREPSAEEAEWIERITADVDPGEALHAYGGHTAPEPAPEENVYVGLASLRPFSPILVAPDGARWAESVEHPLEVRVRWDRDADHAQLLRIPGLFVSAERAWVRVRSLAIPE